MSDTFRPHPPPSAQAPKDCPKTPPQEGWSDASGNEDRMPPVIVDPYLFQSPPSQPSPPSDPSPLAVTALIAPLLLGPLGSILGIVFGLRARKQYRSGAFDRTGHTMATVGLVLGVVLTVFWGGALTLLVVGPSERRELAQQSPPVPTPRPPLLPPQTSASPDTPRRPSPTSDPTGAAPRATRIERIGEITVVDVGAQTSSLADELAKQRALAAKAYETVLVMTTSDQCDPCRGVDRSLPDPLLQTALSKVRLVRVDLEVFSEDLDVLRIPYLRHPGFFLLAPDLSPRDGIDGGEWDADIPVNIAPVLHAFVRGKYTTRREAFTPSPGSGTQL